MTDVAKLKFNVNEIYKSIQGEGTRSGLIFTFIRLQGCLLRCSWCDTPYALERKEVKTLMNGDRIYSEILDLNCKRIMLTGGEPLEQEDVFEFINFLCDEGYEVVIETNGQVLCDKVDNRAIKILDMKCPLSKMSKKNDYRNLELLNIHDELKFVIAGKEDFEWAIKLCSEKNLFNREFTVLFSPAFGLIEEKLLAQWIIDANLPVKMQLQTHKYIWSPTQRGV